MLDRGVGRGCARAENARAWCGSLNQNDRNGRIAHLRTGATLAEAAAVIGMMGVVRRERVRRVTCAMRTDVHGQRGRALFGDRRGG